MSKSCTDLEVLLSLTEPLENPFKVLVCDPFQNSACGRYKLYIVKTKIWFIAQV